jgi:hypothetical protein
MNQASLVKISKLNADPTYGKRIEDKRLIHKRNSVGEDCQVKINLKILLPIRIGSLTRIQHPCMEKAELEMLRRMGGNP